MGTNTCEIRVGRLMEIRIDHGFHSVAEVEAMDHTIGAAFATLPSQKSVVICADWRRTQLMADGASDRFGQMIGAYNARIERSGILSNPDSPVSVLQFMRVVRESSHPRRKLFQDAASLTHYLQDLLTPAELARLRDFLARV
jgi:hypothetical protein